MLISCFTASVPPLPSEHASSSSTPRIPSIHGSLHGLSLLSLPARPNSAPPLLAEMTAIQPWSSNNPTALMDSSDGNAPVHPERDTSEHPAGELPPASETVDLAPQDMELPAPTLRELIEQLRSQKYHRQRGEQAQQSLRSLQVAAVRTARLARSARTAHHTLAECIKAEDKTGFLNLWNTLQDACDDCSNLVSSSGLNSEAEALAHSRSSSFFEDVSPNAQTTILTILTKLRNDENFITHRLGELSPKELTGLLPDSHRSRSTGSVMGGSIRSGHGTHRPLGFIVDAQVEEITSRNFNSPLEALVFLPSGLADSDAIEYERMTEVWASVGANFISQMKPGRERLVSALLDLWAAMQPWPGKDRLALWLLQTLQRGTFILDQPTKQTFRARVEGRPEVPVEEEIRTERFVSDAADSLLALLSDPAGASVLPSGALQMCNAMSAKLKDMPTHQNTLHLIMTGWVFSTFLVDATSLPEVRYRWTSAFFASD